MTNTEKEAIADRCYCLFWLFILFLSYLPLCLHIAQDYCLNS